MSECYSFTIHCFGSAASDVGKRSSSGGLRRIGLHGGVSAPAVAVRDSVWR